jgi:serine/threonine protein kinase
MRTSQNGTDVEFDHIAVFWKGEDGTPHWAQHDQETFDLDMLDNFPDNPIPREHIYPVYTPDLLVAPESARGDAYIKERGVLLYSGTEWTAKLLLGEAKVLSHLERQPHPNICRFLGCRVSDDGRIEGLYLQKYPRTLADALPYDDDMPSPTSDDSTLLDRQSVLHGIVQGIKYIHSLGFSHNDLNPRNIMLDDSNVPIIIDFDACKPVGTSMKGQKVFTAPWGRRNPENKAMYENDYLSLGLIKLYL